jgi:hypothetical protein
VKAHCEANRMELKRVTAAVERRRMIPLRPQDIERRKGSQTLLVSSEKMLWQHQEGPNPLAMVLHGFPVDLEQ